MEFVIALIASLVFLSSAAARTYKVAAALIASIGFAAGMYAVKDYPLLFWIVAAAATVLIAFNAVIFLKQRRKV